MNEHYFSILLNIQKGIQTFSVLLVGSSGEEGGGSFWSLPFLEAPDNSLFLVVPTDINASISDKWKISL